jgi:lipopolysaccharide export LptBFGC system permease protein LptF
MYRIIGLVFAAALFSLESFAAPRAESAEECAIAADMALVAESLAGEAIQRPKAGAIMTRIYGVAESERGKALMNAILDAAYTRKASTPRPFADELLAVCLKSAGNMDSVLGRSL